MTASLPYRRAVGGHRRVAGVRHRHRAEEVRVDAHVQIVLRSARTRDQMPGGSADHRARVGGAGRACRRGSTTIAWAWPKPLSYAGRAATSCPRDRETGHPVVGSVSLDDDGGPLGAGPCVEPGAWGRCSAQRPCVDRPSAGDLAVVEQPGRELQEDLRLGVAAHRAEHRSEASRRRRRHRRAQRVRRPATGCELGGVACAQAEAETAVVQVDPGVRFDQPRIRSRRRSTGSATRPCRFPSTVHR